MTQVNQPRHEPQGSMHARLAVPVGKARAAHRRRDMEALHAVAVPLLQETHHLLRFQSFRHHFDAEGPAERDRRFGGAGLYWLPLD